MNKEMTDDRRAALESRRYHLELVKKNCDGPEWNGEFFYDSIRAARAFVRKEFDAWCKAQAVDFGMRPKDWRDAWNYKAIFATVKDEVGCEGAFWAQLVDAQNPDAGKGVYGMDCDFSEEGQQLAQEGWEAQGEDGAEAFDNK